MLKIHCDRCDATEKPKPAKQPRTGGLFSVHLPEGWATKEHKDLCPSCLVDLERFLQPLPKTRAPRPPGGAH